MSGRFGDFDKGSSRSARDDSRGYKERERDKDDKDRRRTRSRSPRTRHSPPSSSRSRYTPDRPKSRDKDYDDARNRKKSWDSDSDSPEEVPAPPPPPRISKISIGFTKPKAPIKMSIGAKTTAPPKRTVASVFNADDDDDDEPEEMPAEAKMRMRNIGRETPTSAGPNSFGKTKQGFCDAKKVFEKNLKQALETPAERSTVPKFPQTIYKIKP